MSSPHRLILLRHAKSSWKDTSLPDDERPLAGRGRRALPMVAKYLRGTGLTVELVLCSPARRTRQTLDGVRAGLRGEPEVRIVREIYEATADELLEILHQVERRYGSVLLIGHNPGMEELVGGLVSGGDEGALTRLREGFPTAALATLSSDLDWADLSWRRARLDSFVRPRDLDANQDVLAVVERFNEAWNSHDLPAALALTTDDCIFEATAPAPDGARVQGRAGLAAAWQPIFADTTSHFTTEEAFVAGDRVVARWRYEWDGGHIRGVDVIRVRGGLVAEKLAYVKG